MTKAELRKLYLQKRLALTAAQRDLLNLRIYHHFFAWPELNVLKTLHVYLSLEEKGEPDTWSIIDKLRREHAHIRLVVPRVSREGELDHIFLEGLHQLKKSKWNIWEPQQGVEAFPAQLDAVIVPLLAYDWHGHRVGYGRGFYDQFLAQCRPDCRRIGLSFFEPVDKIEDVRAEDVALDAVICPTGFRLSR